MINWIEPNMAIFLLTPLHWVRLLMPQVGSIMFDAAHACQARS